MSKGTPPATSLNYTGQWLDGSGLLYYHARYYDPALARFVSADSIVPGSASGSGGAAASLGYDSQTELRPLTVDFHEPGSVAELAHENAFTQQHGFWFQLSDEDQQQAKLPWGPANPQALNRYSYALNNPVRYVDPTGHWAVAVAIVAGILEGAGIAAAAPIVAAIAATLAVATILWCVSDAGCRDWVAMQVQAGIDDVNGFTQLLAKKTKQSGKEAASDIPSWAKGKGKQGKEDGKTAARRIMDEQYGKGEWEKDLQRQREYSQIKKNLDRKE